VVLSFWKKAKDWKKSEIAFHPVTDEHYGLLGKWFKAPHVVEWWLGTDGFDEMKTNIKSQAIEAYILVVDGQKVGYIQTYHAKSVGGGWWPDEKEGTWGIDQFIGEKKFLGRKLGRVFVRKFVEKLFAEKNARKVITDPAPNNKRAIKAYYLAGFSRGRVTQTPDGPALVMELIRGPHSGAT
jgi:RimJ/RimL family protein N-acetyltransferase